MGAFQRQVLTRGGLDLIGDVGVLAQELLGVLPPLRQTLTLTVVVRTPLLISNFDVNLYQDELRESAEKSLQDIVAEKTTASQSTHIVIGYGDAANEIVRTVEKENIDLIVIATHGATGIEHQLIGSVTEKVVRQAPCPVFTIKAFGKSLL